MGRGAGLCARSMEKPGLPAAINWLQLSFMNVAPCQNQTQETWVQLCAVRFLMTRASVQELADTHSTKLKSSQEIGTNPLILGEQRMSGHGGALYQSRASLHNQQDPADTDPKDLGKRNQSPRASCLCCQAHQGHLFLPKSTWTQQSQPQSYGAWPRGRMFCPPSLYIYGFQATAKNISFSLHQREI